MRAILLILLTVVALISCTQVGKQIDEARKARKKRDSILEAFKEVNDRLDSLNKVYELEKDSIQINLNDTLLSR